MESHSDFPFICGTPQPRCRVAHPLIVLSTTLPLEPLPKRGVAQLSSSSLMALAAKATLMQGRMISLLSRPISWPTSKRITRFLVNVLKSTTSSRESVTFPLQRYISLSYIIAHIYLCRFVPISVAFIVFCFVSLVPASLVIVSLRKIDGWLFAIGCAKSCES